MPATIRQRLIDLLAIGRVANLPTVWSNVIVGFLLAWSTADVFFLAQVNTDEVVFRSNLVALALLLLPAGRATSTPAPAGRPATKRSPP